MLDEVIMPDIQTEMRKVLQAWDAQQTEAETASGPQAKPAPQPEIAMPTTPAPTPEKVLPSRAAFEYIKRNPGSTSKEVSAYLATLGVTGSTLTTATYNLFQRGYIKRNENHEYSVNRERYPTQEEITQSRAEAFRKMRAARSAAAARKEALTRKKEKSAAAVKAQQTKARLLAGVAAPAAAAPASAPVALPTKAEAVLDSLNVMEARLLYTKLKEFFG